MISFIKMHGAGNDFVVLDNREGGIPLLSWKHLADRHTGIGCDQVVMQEASRVADVRMRIFNADGGEVESCGNAARCVALLVYERQPDAAEREIRIETQAGVISARVANRLQVTVDMGEPHLDWQDIPLAENTDTLHLPIAEGELRNPMAVSMGNPHMVFFVPDADAVPLAELGPKLERHALFPKRANVGVAQIGANKNDRTLIRLRVWERGAGLTLACGTGACAALVAAHQRKLAGRKAAVALPGGDMLIEWRENDNHVLMTGAVETVFRGEFNPDTWRIREGETA